MEFVDNAYINDKIIVAYLVRPAEGGIKTHLLTLLDGLDKARYEPVVICPPNTSLFCEAEDAGYRVIPLNLVGEINPAKDLAAIIQLRRILGHIKPHILHIHSAKAGLVGRIAAALMIHRPAVALTVHSFVFDERVGRKKRVIVSWTERRLCQITDRIIAVSRALRDEIIADMGLDPRHISVIYNGIKFQEFSKTGHEGFRIGTVSRLAPQKGVEYFIRAAAIVLGKFPSARFTIIGDGPFRTELEKLAVDLGIGESVEFMGFQSDVLSIVADFDLFVLTSTRETFGLTLVEALSLGVPVVASRVGGIPEIIDGSTTGLLAEPRDQDDIAEKICSLLEDRDFARQLGKNGYEYVKEHFGSDRMVGEVQAVYEDLLAERM